MDFQKTHLHLRSNEQPKKLQENCQELINAIVKLKPSSSKGTYVKGISLATSMTLEVHKNEIKEGVYLI